MARRILASLAPMTRFGFLFDFRSDSGSRSVDSSSQRETQSHLALGLVTRLKATWISKHPTSKAVYVGLLMIAQPFVLRGFSLLATLGFCIACSGSDGNGGGTGTGTGTGTGFGQDTPEKALAETTCYLDLATPDLDKYSGTACSGTDTDSSVEGLGPDSWDDIRMTVSLALNAPPALGKLDVSSLSIQIPSKGTTPSWEAPLDSCTITATDSAKDTDFGWIYFRIDISCTAPATPAEGNPGAPLELGEFTIVTFFTDPT
jgi:hypothetical protein